MAVPAVELRSIVKRFGGMAAVDRVSLEIEEGEFISFLGPSGCGKTTTLRIIAGFIEPDDGEILVMGEDISDRPPHKRNMGMVYQNYALFPHMTIFDNIAYGLRIRKLPMPRIRERVDRALESVQLAGFGDRYPSQLSGGQQQRVALARAVAIEPQVLLLDEPLSNLDAKLRKQMQVEIKDLQRRLGITTIYVTHDQEEALNLSDRIVVMHAGRVMQVGKPSAIYHRPANTFVANFIGSINFLRGRLTERRTDSNQIEFVSAGGTRFYLTANGVDAKLGQETNLAIRPEQIQIGPTPSTEGMTNRVEGVVTYVVYLGAQTTYHVQLPSGECLVINTPNMTEGNALQVGDRAVCWLPAASLRLVAD